MCSNILHAAAVSGSGRTEGGWFALSRASVTYDHPFHVQLEHALNIDVMDAAGGLGRRVALELDLRSARALAEAILAAVSAAETYEGVSARGPAQPAVLRGERGR